MGNDVVINDARNAMTMNTDKADKWNSISSLLDIGRILGLVGGDSQNKVGFQEMISMDNCACEKATLLTYARSPRTCCFG